MPNLGWRGTTIIVAASDSLYPSTADYICSGANDNVEIQAALDALPATGGEVLLLDGTYVLAAVLNMDSYQTLRGCGTNTILSVNGIDATGGSGTEKVGIIIADLRIDSGVGWPIFFGYVDESEIRDVWIDGGGDHGIYLDESDNNKIINNYIVATLDESIYLQDTTYTLIEGNHIGSAGIGIQGAGGSLYTTVLDNIIITTDEGILSSEGHWVIDGNFIESSTDSGIEMSSEGDNVIVGNWCFQCGSHGIEMYGYTADVVVGNLCAECTLNGILAGGSYAIFKGNFCYKNGQAGIYDAGNHFLISGNYCHTNNQGGTTYSNIQLHSADYCLVEGNICRQGAEVNKPVYGIDLDNAPCDKNVVAGNDVHDGGATANFHDIGTLTQVEDDNRGIEITDVKMYRLVTNNTGGAFAVGDVVSLRAIAAGNEITTPAGIGEDSVYGMVAEIIADAASGLVQVKGKTTVLKSTNVGGGAIAIGDTLGTEVGVRARKTAAGDQAFARALEVCNAADCVIDAYIKSPWD